MAKRDKDKDIKREKKRERDTYIRKRISFFFSFKKDRNVFRNVLKTVHRVLHARQIVINRIINSSNFCRCSQDDVSVPGQKGEKKKNQTMVPLYLMMAPLESSASFRASEALQRFTKKKKKKRKKKKERKRKKRKEITKKKERRRNNNNGISNCMLRAACDCVSVFLFFFFFFGKEDNEYIFETVLLTHLGSKMTGPVFSDFFFSSFHFRSVYFI